MGRKAVPSDQAAPDTGSAPAAATRRARQKLRRQAGAAAASMDCTVVSSLSDSTKDVESVVDVPPSAEKSVLGLQALYKPESLPPSATSHSPRGGWWCAEKGVLGHQAPYKPVSSVQSEATSSLDAGYVSTPSLIAHDCAQGAVLTPQSEATSSHDAGFVYTPSLLARDCVQGAVLTHTPTHGAQRAVLTSMPDDLLPGNAPGEKIADTSRHADDLAQMIMADFAALEASFQDYDAHMVAGTPRSSTNGRDAVSYDVSLPVGSVVPADSAHDPAESYDLTLNDGASIVSHDDHPIAHALPAASTCIAAPMLVGVCRLPSEATSEVKHARSTLAEQFASVKDSFSTVQAKLEDFEDILVSHEFPTRRELADELSAARLENQENLELSSHLAEELAASRAELLEMRMKVTLRSTEVDESAKQELASHKRAADARLRRSLEVAKALHVTCANSQEQIKLLKAKLELSNHELSTASDDLHHWEMSYDSLHAVAEKSADDYDELRTSLNKLTSWHCAPQHNS